MMGRLATKNGAEWWKEIQKFSYAEKKYKRMDHQAWCALKSYLTSDKNAEELYTLWRDTVTSKVYFSTQKNDREFTLGYSFNDDIAGWLYGHYLHKKVKIAFEENATSDFNSPLDKSTVDTLIDKVACIDPSGLSIADIEKSLNDTYTDYFSKVNLQSGYVLPKDALTVKVSGIADKNCTLFAPDSALTIKADTGCWTTSITDTLENEIALLREDLEEIKKEKEKEVKSEFYKESKGEKKMNLNFDFGALTTDVARVSPFGIAVKNMDGLWVAYADGKDDVMDVTDFTVESFDMIWKMPVAVSAIKPGDVLIHNRIAVVVTDNSDNRITAIDLVHGEEKFVIPTKNMFGFNYVTKLISVIDGFVSKPTEDNPFGNMLPYMLLSNKDNKDMGKMFMMMAMVNGGFGNAGNADFPVNPMLMYALMQKDNEKIDPMMLMAMSGAFKFN